MKGWGPENGAAYGPKPIFDFYTHEKRTMFGYRLHSAICGETQTLTYHVRFAPSVHFRTILYVVVCNLTRLHSDTDDFVNPHALEQLNPLHLASTSTAAMIAGSMSMWAKNCCC